MGMDGVATKLAQLTDADRFNLTIEAEKPEPDNSRVQPTTGFSANDAGTTDDDEIFGDVNFSVSEDINLGATVTEHPFRNDIEPELQLEAELNFGEVELEVELDNVGRRETQNVDAVIEFPFFLDSSLGVGIENLGTSDPNATLELRRQVSENGNFVLTTDFNQNGFEVQGLFRAETK